MSDITDNQTLALRIPADLAEKIEVAKAATKLNRSALLRLAIERGLERLLDQLELSATETTNTGAAQ